MSSRGRHPPDLVAGEEPALAHDDGAGWNQRQQLQRRLDPRLERAEITVVDAEDARAEGQRRLQLGRRVALDQGAQPDPLGRLKKVTQLRRLEDRHDEQDRVGAGDARFPQLVLGQREVLAQERHADGAADGSEKIQMALEILLVGEHGDGVGAVTGIRGGEGHGIERGRQHAARRRRLLHLGDQPHAGGARPQRFFEVAGGRQVPAARLEHGQWRRLLAPVKLLALVADDVVQDVARCHRQ